MLLGNIIFYLICVFLFTNALLCAFPRSLDSEIQPACVLADALGLGPAPEAFLPLGTGQVGLCLWRLQPPLPPRGRRSHSAEVRPRLEGLGASTPGRLGVVGKPLCPSSWAEVARDVALHSLGPASVAP